VVFNADTVALYDRLSNDPETLNQLANAAEQYVQARDMAGTLPSTPSETPQINNPAPAPSNETTTVNPFDSTGATTSGQPAPTTGYQPSEPTPVTYLYSGEDVAEQDFRTSLEDLKGLLNNEIAEIRRPLGMGWEGVSLRSLSTYDLVSKVLGFILTALAISMGAPFWFDLLKKLVNIRSSGSRPYEN